MPNLIPQAGSIVDEIIEKKIYLIRGLNVMLDRDLAELYAVETNQLKRQVRRNIERFPEDFMFELTKEEYHLFLRCQFGTLKRGEHAKYLPYAFTEQGVAMLSSVLNSKRAMQVNIGIMRVFVNIRRIVSTHKELVDKLNELERRVEKHDKKHDKDIRTIFETIRNLMISSQTTLISPKRPFTNKMIVWNIIKSCKGYIYWIDKYFSKVGLELLSESLDYKKVKKIKILMSMDKVDEKLKDLFKDFKKELKNKKVVCELRVITDNKIKSDIHDRWIISKDVCFNIPSTDTLARGQYSEIKKTTNKPPFDEWWNNSKDIVSEWDRIQNRKNKSFNY